MWVWYSSLRDRWISSFKLKAKQLSECSYYNFISFSNTGEFARSLEWISKQTVAHGVFCFLQQIVNPRFKGTGIMSAEVSSLKCKKDIKKLINMEQSHSLLFRITWNDHKSYNIFIFFTLKYAEIFNKNNGFAIPISIYLS